jgi:hypothetical protein
VSPDLTLLDVYSKGDLPVRSPFMPALTRLQALAFQRMYDQLDKPVEEVIAETVCIGAAHGSDLRLQRPGRKNLNTCTEQTTLWEFMTKLAQCRSHRLFQVRAPPFCVSDPRAR